MNTPDNVVQKREWHTPISENWRELIGRASLPLFALAGSWGVFEFSKLFVPWLVAALYACSFELAYIGIAVQRDFTPDKIKRARILALAAMTVSVVYNWLSGWLHSHPSLLISVNDEQKFSGILGYWEIAGLTLLHAAPLPIMAFALSELLFHGESEHPAVKALRELKESLVGKLVLSQQEIEEIRQEYRVTIEDKTEAHDNLVREKAELDKQYGFALAELEASRNELEQSKDKNKLLETAQNSRIVLQANLEAVTAERDASRNENSRLQDDLEQIKIQLESIQKSKLQKPEFPEESVQKILTRMYVKKGDTGINKDKALELLREEFEKVFVVRK